ncbi:MAG: T9SS type A sorting domain-containing protein [Ignavibacteria bacterium]|nr:T9SS type A sorting domain-containing protein [Ignavibacteria bacterium]
MKKIFGLTVGIATAIILMLSLQITANAQVYGDFDTVRQIRNVPYEPLEDGIEIPPSAFGLPPMWLQDLDDGYSFPNGIDIGFPFEFGGEVYTRLWVCINGFVTFSQPPLVPAKDPTALFYMNASYPKNVLAPYWGDHYYHTDVERFNGYKPTKIYYKSDPDRGVFIVEWRFLNINDVNVKSSIATFQLRLYKSQDPYSAQGDIEFAYGQVGGNEYTNDTRVITRNASVGIKGEFDPADFLNGLEYGKSPAIAKSSMKLTNEWAPSGGTDYRIRFRAMARFNVEEFWGDGDVDLSKGYNRKHYNMPQSRYVTVNDARLILRSVATGIPLDSVRRREAYHGDVNHNGRYYYNQFGVRKEIRWRNKYYGDSLPGEIGSIKQIFYQANEYDAALILHYISARIPELPWLYDTIPQYGKIDAREIANNIIFGEFELINNQVRVPIYLNGDFAGPLSIYLEMNEPFTIVKNNSSLEVDYQSGRGVIAGSGEFSSNIPIAYLTFEKPSLVLDRVFVRFNENQKNPIFLLGKVKENDNINAVNILDNGTKSPVVNLNIAIPGSYNVEVLDASGKVVYSSVFNINGLSNFNLDWNTEEANIGSGVYFVRLTGNGTNIVEKIIIIK